MEELDNIQKSQEDTCGKVPAFYIRKDDDNDITDTEIK